MDIPVNAEVHCVDGPCGHVTSVIVNPTNWEITHLVVKEKRFPHTERLVSIDEVVESTPHQVRLRCTTQELSAMDPFIETQFIQAEAPECTGGPCLMWPYVVPEDLTVRLETEHIPPGELAVHRGDHVEATDGRVGRIDEFLVDPANGHITHLVLREGHLSGQKDVTIPVSAIDRIEEDTVYLKLDKRSIEALPTIPIRRR